MTQCYEYERGEIRNRQPHLHSDIECIGDAYLAEVRSEGQHPRAGSTSELHECRQLIPEYIHMQYIY